jgi:hypothetical protein
MIPIAQVSDELREQLDGRPPRELIRFVPAQLGVQLAHLMAPEDLAITQTQWSLYHDTGRKYFPNPFWCVQGEHGGHKLQYTTLEKKMLRHAGLPSEAPAPGDLPYAPIDERTFAQLTRLMTLKQADREFKALRAKNPELYRRLKDEREKDYRRMVWKTVMDSIAPEEAREVHDVLRSDKLMHGTRAVEVPRDTIDWDRALETAERTYVETGRVPRNPSLL